MHTRNLTWKQNDGNSVILPYYPTDIEILLELDPMTAIDEATILALAERKIVINDCALPVCPFAKCTKPFG